MLPISQWFDPELKLPRPDTLDDRQLHDLLWETIDRLYDKRIVLDFTDHLSDRELYCLLIRDILPSAEKKIDVPENYLHWHCLDADDDPEIWLRYYASQEEREAWAEEAGQPLPPAEIPPSRAVMPGTLSDRQDVSVPISLVRLFAVDPNQPSWLGSIASRNQTGELEQ